MEKKTIGVKETEETIMMWFKKDEARGRVGRETQQQNGREGVKERYRGR